MKKQGQTLFLIMILTTETLLTNDNITTLRDDIRVTSGDVFIITDGQLSRVVGNPFVTPTGIISPEAFIGKLLKPTRWRWATSNSCQ